MKKSFLQWLVFVFAMCAMVMCGYALTTASAVPVPDAAGALADQLVPALVGVFQSLPLFWQQAVMVVIAILTAIPHLAPWTPWTWDDETIRYKPRLVHLFANCWNVLAGNYRRSSNAPGGGS